MARGGVLLLLMVAPSLAPWQAGAPVRRGFVRAAVPVSCAQVGVGTGQGCRGTAVAVGVGEGVAGCVLQGLGSGVVRCGLPPVLFRAPSPVGGRIGGPRGPSSAFLA